MNEPSSPAAQRLADRALAAGLRAARAGQRNLARQLLLKVTELDPLREQAWLGLSGVAANAEEARAYLKTVLALNPTNRQAQEALRQIPPPPPGPRDNSTAARCPTCGAALGPGTEPSSIEGTEAETPAGKPAGEITPALSLSVEQAEAVDRCLDKMVAKSHALCIILADVTGRLIAERGHTRSMNPQVLSALVAGELVATHELARLVGERARFRLLLNEGQNQNVYLSDVNEQMILVIVSNTNTAIGLVRMVLKQAVEELAPILAQPPQPTGEMAASETLGGDFAQLLESELDASWEV